MLTPLSEVIVRMVISGKLKMSAYYTDRKNPFMDDNAKMNNYNVTIKYGRKQYKLIFSQGLGIKNKPDVKSVLGCLLSDISSGDSFEDFCDCFGYDQDSRKAYTIYKGCEKEKKNLLRLFGDDLQTLLNAENDI